MNLTSSTSQSPSNSTLQAKTLSSLCNWWMNTKEKALPGICHWFNHPQKIHRRFSLNVESNQSSNSSFTPFGYSENVDMTTLEHPISSDTSISLILLLCSVLFIVLVTTFITCITCKKRVHVLFFTLFSERVFNLSATK